jgi:hypothetical protein
MYINLVWLGITLCVMFGYDWFYIRYWRRRFKDIYGFDAAGDSSSPSKGHVSSSTIKQVFETLSLLRVQCEPSPLNHTAPEGESANPQKSSGYLATASELDRKSQYQRALNAAKAWGIV